MGRYEFCYVCSGGVCGRVTCFAADDPATVSGDLVMWDLSVPCKVVRQAVMALDQIGGFSSAVASGIVREVTVPKMPLGQWSIDVTANFPAHRGGLGEIGVSVEIAANPPWRPASVNHQLALVEPEDSANFQLQLSPREALSYTAVPYAVLAGVGAQVQNYTGAVSQHADTWIRLSMEDFPVAFAHISATPALLALADITVQFSYTRKWPAATTACFEWRGWRHCVSISECGVSQIDRALGRRAARWRDAVAWAFQSGADCSGPAFVSGVRTASDRSLVR